MTDARGGTPTLAAVSTAYRSWATAYVERLGSADLAPAEDRDVISGWSGGVHGRVLDAGCGPGHWSAFLRDRGLQVQGVDATPEFLDHARSSRPDIPFELGDLRSLDLPVRSFGGVLAWFSVIHTDPEAVPSVLRTFAEGLQPGGSLLIGFFSGDDLRPFDHRVVTAWAWPLDTMAAAIEGAGLLVSSRREWPTPNGRRNAAIVAHRPPDHHDLA